MKLLEMGKDMKIKNSVSSPPFKVYGNIFRKKAFWANLLEDVLHGD